MNGRSTRHRRRRRQDHIGIAILVFCVLFAAALGFVFMQGGATTDASNCPRVGPTGITVVLVDFTDRISAPQQLDVRNRLTSLIETVATGEAVQLWKVAPSAGEVPTPLSDLVCNPGNESNPWIQNPRFVERQYVDKYLQPLFSQLESLIQGGPEAESPIMESIQAIALRTFEASAARSARVRRLIVVSDLEQHTSNYSVLRSRAPFDDFLISGAQTTLGARLDDVEVAVFYLSRAGQRNERALIELWQTYISQAGGRLVSVERLMGAS